MRGRMRLLVGGALALMCWLWTFVAAFGSDSDADRYQRQIEPVLVEFCYGCHGDGMRKGGVSLDQFASREALLADRELWGKVLKNVRAGIMPPAGAPRLEAQQIHWLAEWIKRDVFQIDPQHPDPGRVTIRRLNREEYRNTIRDLMGIDFRVDEEFPPDDTGYGFDNIGDVLSVSPLLLEKYLQAAESIVDSAVPLRPRVVREQRIAGDKFMGGDDGARTGERVSFYESARLGHSISVDKRGDFRLILEVAVAGEFDFDPGRNRMRFLVDGEELLQQEFGWHNFKRFELPVHAAWEAGDHRLELQIEPLTPKEQKKNSLEMRLIAVRVQGPLDPADWAPSANYDRFFSRSEPPADESERLEYARHILTDFARRAYRRPAEAAHIERLTRIAEGVFSRPEQRFEQGIAQAMTAVLSSPRFLFRLEQVAPLPTDGGFAAVDDYALASRLSYFLWSSMPDDELFRLAELGLVRERLGPQVRRMIADSRSDALVENFVGQWLQTRDVETIAVNPRAVLRREGREGKGDGLDRELRRALRRETEMYFAHILRENRSLLELLESNYTFANERLAKHYDLPGVEGRRWRQVTFAPDSPRGGVLTHGSVLVITSNPTRTSPVKRGQFILENVLGTPAPPPPAAVPELEAAEKKFQGREPTLRETLELHRNQPLCHACHARMDPLGLALENFNALGMWRDSERGQPIDPRGQLATGETFEGVRELKHILTHERRTDFYRCFTEKLLTYALGRGLEDYDVQTVDDIVERLEREGGAFSTLLQGIVESAPFLKRR
ncbi:MAG: DUF1592 domain-containing protein [Planctomycetales bacterium]